MKHPLHSAPRHIPQWSTRFGLLQYSPTRTGARAAGSGLRRDGRGRGAGAGLPADPVGRAGALELRVKRMRDDCSRALRPQAGGAGDGRAHSARRPGETTPSALRSTQHAPKAAGIVARGPLVVEEAHSGASGRVRGTRQATGTSRDGDEQARRAAQGWARVWCSF